MPILNPSPAQVAAQQVQSLSLAGFRNLQQFGQQGFNLIWNNPSATPQEVFAALGTNASAATIGGATAPNMPSIPSGWTVTPNTDGTVTVTAPSSAS